MEGNNNFHNCTTNVGGTRLAFIDLSSGNTTTDPTFTNAGSNDYRVGTNAADDGWPGVVGGPSGLTTSQADVGCAQRAEAGGSGGGGKQVGGGGGQVG